jgi:hypothetical protein
MIRIEFRLAVILCFLMFPGTAAVYAGPAKVALVYPPADSAGFEVGMLQVTFSDGHTEFFDKSNKCGRPKISKHGDIGWSVWVDSFPGRFGHSYEILRMRTRDGELKEFRPNAYFVMDWGFDDHDTAVVIESMEHHGPAYYIKYAMLTGKVLGRQDEYRPYAEMPGWAQPYSDEKP